MSKNPFVVLGISENATANEAYDAYKELRNKYEQLRFEPGEVGAEACAKLQEIDDAYDVVVQTISARDDININREENTSWNTTQQEDSNFEEYLNRADEYIKQGNIDEAQKYLDNCTSRSARWHYLQAAIFYRKGWEGDALKQLEFACNMDPTNTSYKEAKERMEKHVKAHSTSQEQSFYNNGNRQQQRSYSENSHYDQRAGRRVGNICCDLICLDSCCECFGFDLIPCC